MEASNASCDDLLEDALRQLRETRSRLETAERASSEPIAIVGAAARLPGNVVDLETLWRLLDDGVDAVAPLVIRSDGRRPLAPDSGDGLYQAGSLATVDHFDAEFFGISASEARCMDPQQRLVLEVAWEAVEEAGLPVEKLRAGRTGVFLGLYGCEYLAMQLADADSINVYSGPGCAHSIVANRLSYLLDLHGPSLVVDTACSSSLVAVHLACRALRQGDCDFALAGGVNLILSSLSMLVTEKLLPLASSGRCRTFDACAEGIVRGEGCGIVVLERAREAKSAGHHAHALIRGTAVNQDGRTNGLTAPSPRAQCDVLGSALADAAVDPADVVYVETHGTATPLGDPIEMDALCKVYGAGAVPCGLGSVKTNIGHLEAAAGIAGLLKAMLILERGVIPPHLHLERLNPEIDLAGTRLHVPTAPTPLPPSSVPSLAAVSAFGFGGTNAHAVLEAVPVEDADTAATFPYPRTLLLAISARSPEALVELANLYADSLHGCSAREGAELCAAAALHRTHHPCRYAVVAGDVGRLVRQLRCAGRAVPANSRGRVGEDRPLAFVFSGQGSQWPQMGRDVLATQAVVRREVEACDALVRRLAGWSLIEQLEAPQAGSRLHETEIAQLAIAALQLGLAELWRAWGFEPSAVVGHSMGEIVAAGVAGALDREATLELLWHRARIIERASAGGTGAMATIPLAQAGVLPLLDATEGRVEIAALNGPSSTVVAGEGPAVERLVALAASTGIRARLLRVNYAFHSWLLDGCDAELAAAVGHIRARDTNIAIYSTVTGGRVDPGALDAEHWGRNLREPVLLQAAMSDLARDEIVDCIEIGPHPILLEDISATLGEHNGSGAVVGSLRRRRTADSALYTSLAGLYNAGLGVCWERIVAEPLRRVELPRYPWQRRRHWLSDSAGIAILDELATRVEPYGPPGPVATDGALAEMPVARRLEVLTQYVRAHLADALGLESIEDIACDASLEALGLESLTVVELRNQVEREFSIKLPLQVLLDGDTAANVARAVVEALDSNDLTESVELDNELDGMSDKDVDAALAVLIGPGADD